MSIELDDISSGYNLSKINKNFQTVETYLNDVVLSRAETGIPGEAKMERDLDMDGNSILNAFIGDIDLQNISDTVNHSLRIPLSENAIPPLIDVNGRKGKVLGFDPDDGLPTVYIPASGSASDVLMQLASSNGSTLIGDGTGTVYSEYTPSEFKRKTSFSSGGILTTNKEAAKDNNGIWWIYTGTLPKTVIAGSSPLTDTNYYAVGLLNGLPVNNLSSWRDPTSTADITALVQQFFRSMYKLGHSAIIEGNIKVSDSVQCYDVPYDMSNATLTIPLNTLTASALNNGFIFETSEPSTTIVNNFTVDFALRGADSSSIINQFGDCTFAWEAEDTVNDKAYLRSNGQVVQKTGICVSTVTDRAIFRSTPLLYTVSGPVTAYVKPFRNQITIKLPSIVLQGAYADINTQLEQIFQVTRNNVEVIGGSLSSVTNTQVKVRTLVAVQRCAFVTVRGIEFSGSLVNYEYGISYFNVASLSIRDCVFPRIWAPVDGNFVRGLIIERCTLAGKFGGHVGMWDVTVRDCKLYGIALPGNQATGGLSGVGGGTALVENCEYFYSGGNHAEESFFATRQDYGQAWDGDVIVRNNTVWYNSNNIAFNAVYLAGANTSTLDYTRPYCFFGRRVIVENIRFKPATTNLPPSLIDFRAVGFSRAAGWSMIQRFPDNVSIKDIKAYNMDGSNGGLNLILDVPGYQSDVTRWASSIFNCEVSDVDFRGGLSLALALPTPAAPTSLITQNITMKDCIGGAALGLAGKGDSWEFRNMTLDNITVTTAASSALTVKVRNCDLQAATCGSNNAGDRFYFYESHGTLSTGTLNVGSRAVYCHGNTIPIGGGISGRTLDEWFAYRDNTIFRTV